jgi:hypothetical protein
MVIDDVLYGAALWLLIGSAAAWYFARAAQRLRHQPRGGTGRRALNQTHRAEPHPRQPGMLDAAALLRSLRVDEHA